MTTKYSIRKYLDTCLPLVLDKKWGPLVDTLAELAYNIKYRGRTRAYLGALNPENRSPLTLPFESISTSHIIPLSVWTSALPWEVRTGLQNHCVKSLEYNDSEKIITAWRTGKCSTDALGVPSMLFYHSEIEKMDNCPLQNGRLRYHIGRTSFDLDLYFFDSQGYLCGSGELSPSMPDEIIECPSTAMFALEVKRGTISMLNFAKLIIPQDRKPQECLDAFSESPFIHGGNEFTSTSALLHYKKTFYEKVIRPLNDFLSSESAATIPIYRGGELYSIKFYPNGIKRYHEAKCITFSYQSLCNIGLSHIMKLHDINEKSES